MSVEGRFAPGDVLAGYVVEELVGRGGMGEVYRARDQRLDRPVALKLLAPRLADDEGFRERLLRESRLAASLDHPNVVPIYETGEADGRLFIAMRYVEGTDLKALLRREGALSPERTVALAGQVADALDAAHARGLVHRDVKPSNVLIDEQGGREHCYLADFGLTQSVSDRGPADGQLMGTLEYVAPEQIRGDAVDGRADVYALGCLLFEALTGTLPFTGASDVALIYSHLEEEPPAGQRATPRPPRRGRRRARRGRWPRTRPRARRAAARSSPSSRGRSACARARATGCAGACRPSAPPSPSLATAIAVAVILLTQGAGPGRGDPGRIGGAHRPGARTPSPGATSSGPTPGRSRRRRAASGRSRAARGSSGRWTPSRARCVARAARDRPGTSRPWETRST